MTAKVFDYKTGKQVTTEQNHCSFCKKPEAQVTHLFGNGSNKFVCSECIKKFKEYQ